MHNAFNRLKLLFLTILAFPVLFQSSISSQTLFQAFRKLSRPEKHWVYAHPFVAPKAFRITQQALRESEKSRDDKRLDGLVRDGQSDAFRHAVWMGILAQHISQKKARKLGEAHEKGNYIDFLHHRGEEGALPDSVSGAMDLFNNLQGIRIGTENPGLDVMGLKELIIKAILNGEMRIVLRNKQLEFTDCEGKAISQDLYKDKWNIPRCLVPSNHTP
jgi:hypothetical protein